VTGKRAEAALGRAHITCNKNGIPVRPGKALRDLGRSPRHAGRHHARLRRSRIPPDRQADRRGAGRPAFNRDKLLRSVEIAVRKRNVDPERIDRAVTGIVRQLESSGETEIASEDIGRLVMEALKALDDVAYVRFASVYRNFREAKDFHDVLGELRGDEDER
jgi:transcriptional repressor NrdR